MAYTYLLLIMQALLVGCEVIPLWKSTEGINGDSTRS